MRKLLFFLIVFITNNCFSQSLIWEFEKQLDTRMPNSLMPTLMDSEGNFITMVDEGWSPRYNSYFLKFDVKGDSLLLLSYKSFYSSKFQYPASLFETSYEYKVLYGSNNNSYPCNKDINTGLPMIFNLEKNGDSINQIRQNLIDTLGFLSGSQTKNTFSYNNNFYNAYIKPEIQINENTTQVAPHLIIQCYDSNGNSKWRFGLDTNNQSYIFRDMKFTSDSNFLVLCEKICQKYLLIDTIMQIFKFDTNGKVKERLEILLSKDSLISYSVSIEQLNDGNYAILGENAITHLYSIVEYNHDRKILKSYTIPKKNMGCAFYYLKKTPQGNLIAIGYSALSNQQYGVCKQYLYQVNSNLNFIWDFELLDNLAGGSSEQYKSSIKDLLFIDSNNFIVIGYKNNYNFYVAKFNQTKEVSVKDDPSLNTNFLLSPNPAFDILTINNYTNNYNYLIEIYNIYGIKVYEVPYSDKLDISKLSAGVYYLKINNIIKKFIKI